MIDEPIIYNRHRDKWRVYSYVVIPIDDFYSKFIRYKNAKENLRPLHAGLIDPTKYSDEPVKEYLRATNKLLEAFEDRMSYGWLKDDE
jgi:hypothetical protein